ncbi:hypothetical protein C0J52_19278 [Blattella germanica]|nr:hypothetical protein C0J52_19278 [Blattella germanica]
MFQTLIKTVNDLPDDVLIEIFTNFSAEELVLYIGLVNTRWNRLVQTWTLWKNLTFTPPLNMSKENIVQCLKYMPKLKSLKLHHEKYINEIITAVCDYCVDLKSVVVEWKRGLSLDILYGLLCKFPNIECLDVLVPGAEFNFDYAKLFGNFFSQKRLSALNNKNSHCSKSLSSFTKNYPFLNKDAILQKLKENKCNLEIIAISGTLSVEMLQCIGNCSNLKYLYIANDHFYESTFDMSFLGKLINLNTLQLQCFHNCSLHCSIPNQIYYNLVKLEMVGCGDSIQFFMNDMLKSCPKLKHLNIQEIDLEDENLINISCCKSLTYLDVSDSYIISDSLIKYVANGCHNLEFLDVSYCDNMTSNIIEILTPCRYLQCLHINGIPELYNSFTKIPKLFPYIKEKTVYDLPDDVLFEIFSYFSAEELALTIGMIDTRWNTIAQTGTLWKNLTFTPSPDTNDRYIAKYFRYMPKLRYLKLRHGIFFDQIITAMCKHCEDIKAVVMELKRGPNLHSAKKLLHKFPNIQSLDVYVHKVQFNIDYAKLFGEFHRKNRISLLESGAAKCTNFLDQFLEPSSLTNEEFIQMVEENKYNLETIVISFPVTVELVQSIGSCSNLKYLYIANDELQYTDFDVFILNKLKTLETLQYLSKLFLTDVFVKLVASGCLNLQFLDASYCVQIKNNIIEILTPCQYLECLRMDGIQSLNSSILEIPLLFPQIKEISVKHCYLLKELIDNFTTDKWTGINILTCFERYEFCNSSNESDPSNYDT